jgi:predicted nuclease of predicted toxin-antitoxin system
MAMKLKLDENLGKGPRDIFINAGHDVMTVAGQHMEGASDHELISAVSSEQRCLVTLDVDFANPLLFPPRMYSGIVVLRLPSRPTYEDLVTLCRTLVAALAKGELHGKLWIVQKRRIREYQPEDVT